MFFKPRLKFPVVACLMLMQPKCCAVIHIQFMINIRHGYMIISDLICAIVFSESFYINLKSVYLHW